MRSFQMTSRGFLVRLLGGSWVVISGVISRVTIHVRGLITLLITTHEPPSMTCINGEVSQFLFLVCLSEFG